MKPLTLVRFGPEDDAGKPVLVLGPSLGTSVRTLWQDCADRLADRFTVLGWELPGHGGRPSDEGFSLAELADAVLAAVDHENFYLAGDSVGGAVALHLSLAAPDRVRGAVLCCTAPKIGTAAAWHDRAALVRREGTAALVPSTPARWFGTGFAEREPALSTRLLTELAEVEPSGYAAVCEALAEFDLRGRLAEIRPPVVAAAGADDQVCPPARARHIAAGVRHGRAIVLPNVGHLAPAEAPAEIAELILGLTEPDETSVEQVRADGMRVRREVLGDAHVDRAGAHATGFDQEFQDFITQYAWGTIWTRPGLDRRDRSLITLIALIARGHHDELAMHVRAARRNGVTEAELAELFLQSAIYCGVPDANTAFRIARQVLAEDADDA